MEYNFRGYITPSSPTGFAMHNVPVCTDFDADVDVPADVDF